MSEAEEELPEWAKALLPGLARSRAAFSVRGRRLRARMRAVEAAHEGPVPFSDRDLLAALEAE